MRDARTPATKICLPMRTLTSTIVAFPTSPRISEGGIRSWSTLRLKKEARARMTSPLPIRLGDIEMGKAGTEKRMQLMLRNS